MAVEQRARAALRERPRGDGRARPRRADRRPAASTAGFEGAVTYMSGFQIVHRYAYVVLPADGDPFVVFPTRGALRRRARDDAAIEQVFARAAR